MSDPSQSRLPRRFELWALRLTVVFVLLTVVLAVWGTSSPPRDADGEGSALAEWTQRVYQAVALLGGEPVSGSSELLAWARITALAFMVLAVAGVVYVLFRHLTDRLGRSWIALRSWRRPERAHVVVFGLGRIGSRVARDLREAESSERRPVIVVEIDPDHSGIADARRRDASVVIGDAGSAEVRRQARLERAAELFVCCGDDATNVDLAIEVLRDHGPGEGGVRRSSRFRDRGRRRERLQCYVHLADPELSRTLSEENLLRGSEAAVDFHPFNLWENAARRLVIDPEQGLATVEAPAPDEVFHAFVFGFGEMGQAVALQVARLAHFPGGRRPRLSVLDENVGRVRDLFLARYPGFAPEKGVDLDRHHRRTEADKDSWSFRDYHVPPVWRVGDERGVEYVAHAEFLELSTSAEAPELIEALRRRLDGNGGPTVRGAVVICFADERRNLRTALRLRERIRAQVDTAKGQRLPIYVHLPDQPGLAALMEDQAQDARFPLRAFGGRNSGGSYAAIARPELEEHAMALHHSYVQSLGSELEDPERAWWDLEPWERAANREAAAHAQVKRHAWTHRGADDESLAETEHNRWMAEKLLAGWRFEAYPDDYDQLCEEGDGRCRSAVRREMARRRRRASLLPWSELEEEDRRKDLEQVASIRGVLEDQRRSGSSSDGG